MTDAAPQMPEIGEQAPPIHATTADGSAFDLGEHRGKWVAVYFYVRANTPG